MIRRHWHIPERVDWLELGIALFYFVGCVLQLFVGPPEDSFAAMLHPVFRVALLAIMAVGAGIVLLAVILNKITRLFFESWGLMAMGLGSIVYGIGFAWVTHESVHIASGVVVILLGVFILLKRRQVDAVIGRLPTE